MQVPTIKRVYQFHPLVVQPRLTIKLMWSNFSLKQLRVCQNFSFGCVENCCTYSKFCQLGFAQHPSFTRLDTGTPHHFNREVRDLLFDWGRFLLGNSGKPLSTGKRSYGYEVQVRIFTIRATTNAIRINCQFTSLLHNTNIYPWSFWLCRVNHEILPTHSHTLSTRCKQYTSRFIFPYVSRESCISQDPDGSYAVQYGSLGRTTIHSSLQI